MGEAINRKFYPYELTGMSSLWENIVEQESTMTTIEANSVTSALVGITLAIVAILFAWRIDAKNNELNQSFIETLTSINEKSASTQVAIDQGVTRIVAALDQLN